MTNNDGEVTPLLKALKSGEPSAAERLLPLVYAELHRLASSYMRTADGNQFCHPVQSYVATQCNGILPLTATEYCHRQFERMRNIIHARGVWGC
jgi:ECF sigma factor